MSGYMVARIKKIMPNLVENMILRICHVVEKLWFEFINLYSKFLSKYSLVPNSHYIYWQNCTKSVHEVTKNKDLFAKTNGVEPIDLSKYQMPWHLILIQIMCEYKIRKWISKWFWQPDFTQKENNKTGILF